MKSYPVMNQSQKMQSSVIPGQQFNKQIFIEKSSPTSLDGLYCNVIKSNNGAMYRFKSGKFTSNAVPYFKKSALFKDNTENVIFNAVSQVHTVIIPIHIQWEQIYKNKILPTEIL